MSHPYPNNMDQIPSTSVIPIPFCNIPFIRKRKTAAAQLHTHLSHSRPTLHHLYHKHNWFHYISQTVLSLFSYSVNIHSTTDRLTDRTVPVITSVPLGSVLGPLLMIIYPLPLFQKLWTKYSLPLLCGWHSALQFYQTWLLSSTHFSYQLPALHKILVHIKCPQINTNKKIKNLLFLNFAMFDSKKGAVLLQFIIIIISNVIPSTLYLDLPEAPQDFPSSWFQSRQASQTFWNAALPPAGVSTCTLCLFDGFFVWMTK